MTKRIKNFLFPNKDNNYQPHVFKRSVLSVFIVFLLIINSFSIVFFGGAKQAAASSIDVNRLIELANSERVARGLNTLKTDSRLIAAAQAKGEDMFAKQYWAHYGPNGETPWQFIKAAGYNYIYAGENLAKDFTSTDPIHTAWMNSPTHRDNIINVNYNDIGIAAISGIFDGKETIIVVQMFGSEYIPPAPEPEPEPTPEPEPQPEPTPPQPEPEPEPTPEPTPVPTPPKDTTAPDKPVITEPANGSLLNTSEFAIKGLAEGGSEVAIYDGEERVGTLNADGGAFDYNYENVADGEHVLGATAKDAAGNVSNRSEDVMVTVDTVAPTAKEDSFELISWNEKDSNYKFSITIDGDPTSVVAVLGAYSVNLEETEEGVWSAEFNPEGTLLEEAGRVFTIIISDEAGNESLVDVTIPDLDHVDEPLDELPQTGDEEKSIFAELVERVIGFFVQSSPISKLNVFIGIFLLILAVIDVVVLWKKGIKRKGGESASHIPILILLLIALLFAATGLIL